jgi:hypothetical protein
MKSHDWMEPALDALFDSCSDQQIREALTDRDQLERLRQQVSIKAGLVIPADDQSVNLFMGVMALRLKFPRDVASEKLALNLSMRNQSQRGAR